MTGRSGAIAAASPPDGSSAPDLSVVVPTYRRPDALARTLDALVAQDVTVPWEVVVCDDGSPPPEADAIRGAVSATGARSSAPLRLIRQENAGPAAARNAGARAAQGSLLVFLDDDCAPAPGLLATHLAAHAEQRGDHLAVMGHVAWDPGMRVTPFMELVVRGAQFSYAGIADPERVPFTHFYTANCSLRRETLKRAGWFDATLPPYMEDTEFAYRLTKIGGRVVYRPQAVVHHEHVVELKPYLERQRKAGRAAVEVVERHPELFDLVGVGDVADVGLREQFYTALLRYAFVVGVEEGLAERVAAGAITGEELRGQLEGWVAHWAVRQAGNVRAWRQRAEALQAEVARRDARLAEVTQAKDARIAELEAQLTRLNALPPIRLYQRLKRMVQDRR